FFFSSRRRHTRFSRDWSSDVCSSDLSKDGKFVKWYTREWAEFEAVKENETSMSEIKEALEAAVHRQLMCDVPYGVLLSGGLDSRSEERRVGKECRCGWSPDE